MTQNIVFFSKIYRAAITEFDDGLSVYEPTRVRVQEYRGGEIVKTAAETHDPNFPGNRDITDEYLQHERSAQAPPDMVRIVRESDHKLLAEATFHFIGYQEFCGVVLGVDGDDYPSVKQLEKAYQDGRGGELPSGGDGRENQREDLVVARQRIEAHKDAISPLYLVAPDRRKAWTAENPPHIHGNWAKVWATPVRPDHPYITGEGPSVVMLTEEDTRATAIILQFEAGEGSADIAREFGMTEAAVLVLCKDAGAKPPMTPEKRSEIARRVKAGEPLTEIAAQFWITTRQAYIICRQVHGRLSRDAKRARARQMAKRLQEGESVKAVATEFGATRKQVERIRKMANEEAKLSARRAEIVQRLEDGTPLEAVAREFGVPRKLVKQAWQEAREGRQAPKEERP